MWLLEGSGFYEQVTIRRYFTVSEAHCGENYFLLGEQHRHRDVCASTIKELFGRIWRGMKTCDAYAGQDCELYVKMMVNHSEQEINK